MRCIAHGHCVHGWHTRGLLSCLWRGANQKHLTHTTRVARPCVVRAEWMAGLFCVQDIRSFSELVNSPRGGYIMWSKSASKCPKT